MSQHCQESARKWISGVPLYGAMRWPIALAIAANHGDSQRAFTVQERPWSLNLLSLLTSGQTRAKLRLLPPIGL